jgi:hypothetical protein
VIRDELLAHWDAEASASLGDSYEGRRLLQVTTMEVYAGLEKAGRHRFVALRLNHAQRKSIADRYPRSSKGIAVESIEGGGGKVTFFLREQAGVPNSVFPAVMEDVLVAMESAPRERALRCALERFASWQVALSRQGGAMSGQEVRGIIGELIVARDLLLPCLGAARVVQVWKAPGDEHIHDFVGQGWELEVKTALAPAIEFHVSAEGQLEPEYGNKMILACVELEPSSGGASLRELVDQLLARVEGPVSLREDFRNAIVRRGAFSHSIDDEAARQYCIGSTSLFDVKGAFPLIPRDGLPRGVSALTYQVNLGACSQFEMNEEDLSISLRTTECHQ